VIFLNFTYSVLIHREIDTFIHAYTLTSQWKAIIKMCFQMGDSYLFYQIFIIYYITHSFKMLVSFSFSLMRKLLYPFTCHLILLYILF